MILIALGSNLSGSFDSPMEVLRSAMERLDALGVRILAASSFWATAPVPVSDQPWYQNAVISVETPLSSLELLKLMGSIERAFGRVRSVRDAPRVLDLDLISYGDEIRKEEDFTLPHPRMHERAFVLYPLYEVAPAWRHPVLKRSVKELMAELPDGQMFQILKGEAA